MKEEQKQAGKKNENMDNNRTDDTNEIRQNPNPRANENIEQHKQTSGTKSKTQGVGSEITDGEDG